MALQCLNGASNGGAMLQISARWQNDAEMERPAVAQCFELAPDGSALLKWSAQWWRNASN
jgi:hypothetical protein